jgi:hypothetical protein
MFKDKMIFEYVVYTEEINNIGDNATIYALEKGYIGVDNGKPILDKDVIADEFLNGLSFLLSGNYIGYSEENIREQARKIENKLVVMILVEGDGFYLFIDGQWNEKILFTDTERNTRVNEIEIIINEKLKSRLNGEKFNIIFPDDERNTLMQTISDYTLISVISTNEYTYGGDSYKNCILSAAALTLTEKSSVRLC